MKRLFNPSEGKASGNELPWHNSFNTNPQEIGNEYLVSQIIYCTTGLLLITSHFKDFLYKGKKVTNQLQDAIDYFLEHPKESIPIVLEVSSERSAIIGTIEGYEGNATWIKEGKGAIFKDSTKVPIIPDSSNPFLPTPAKTRVRGKGGGTPKNDGSK